MLIIDDLSIRIAGRLLLDHASVRITPGSRIGLVGRNGAGKSTLFNAITGEQPTETGHITLAPRWRIGRLAQEAPDGPESLIDVVLRGDTERTALLAEAETATDPQRIADIQTRLADICAYAAPARAERLLLDQKLARKQDEKRKHMQAFVDRFRAKATKARQAQSRLKMLEKMETITVAVTSDVRPITFPKPDKLLSPPIIALDGVSVGYEPGRPVLSRLTLRVDPDDRIGLLGSNGNGKSTLVKLIADKLEPFGGSITRAQKLKIAYFAQHQLDELNESASAYDHVRALMPDAPEAAVRTRVGTIGFSGEAADTKVAKLSGGEKARLMLALATFDAPHLLILDEPTNHLDIDSRSALIEAIADYPGATILVSHDRHLLDACADRLLLVADGAVRPFDGDLDDYRRRILTERNDDGKSAKNDKQKDPRLTPEDARKLAAQKRENAKDLRQRVARAQTAIDKQTQAIAKLDEALADGTLFTRDPGKAATFAKERAAAADALATAEEEWLAASEAYETAMA